MKESGRIGTENLTKFFGYSAYDSESSRNWIGQDELTKITNVDKNYYTLVRKYVHIFRVVEVSSSVEDELFLYRRVTDSGSLESFKRGIYPHKVHREHADVKIRISNFNEVRERAISSCESEKGRVSLCAVAFSLL